MKIQGVLLYDLHRLQLFHPCLLGDLVLTLISVIRQMTRVRDIPNVPDLVSQVIQITIDEVECEKGPAVPKVHIAVYRRPADIHPHEGWVQWLKGFLFARERVYDMQTMLHTRKGTKIC